MPKAIWNGAVIAEAPADAVEVVESNVYFSIGMVNPDCLQASDHHSVCPWKGMAHYYPVIVNGEVNQNAVWYYPAPKDAARTIAGRIGSGTECKFCPDRSSIAFKRRFVTD